MKSTHQFAPAAERNRKETVGGANRISTEVPKQAFPKRKTVAAKQTVKVPVQSGKSARRASRKRSSAGSSKLVCRYCGSAELAPSFIKRRDARCRACFKARYGSAAKGADATRTRTRTIRAAK
jgi:hypothetical protein